MARKGKVLNQVLGGVSDANIDFEELRLLQLELGFDERVRGSHHIFTKSDVIEIVNLQPMRTKAKPYQVKQIRNIILKYKLGGQSD